MVQLDFLTLITNLCTASKRLGKQSTKLLQKT